MKIMPEDFPLPNGSYFSKSEAILFIEDFKKKFAPHASRARTESTMRLMKALPDEMWFGYGIGTFGYYKDHNALRYLINFNFEDVKVLVEKLSQLSEKFQVILMLYDCSLIDATGKELMLYSPRNVKMSASLILRDSTRIRREKSLISLEIE